MVFRLVGQNIVLQMIKIMKNYLEYFNKERNTDNHYMYLDGKYKKPKSRDLMFISDLQELFSKIKNPINDYLTIKETLPEVSKSTSDFDYKSPSYHFDRFFNNKVDDRLSSGELPAYFRNIDGI